jgi:hypothetical protein
LAASGINIIATGTACNGHNPGLVQNFEKTLNAVI